MAIQPRGVAVDFRTEVRVYGAGVRAGEAAQRAGVKVATLRYYERCGLLPEPARAPGGHRRYDEEAVRFLRAIKEAQALGFTLAEIEEYLRVVRGGRMPASGAMRVQMAAKIDEIDARIAALRRMRGELARIVGCACRRGLWYCQEDRLDVVSSSAARPSRFRGLPG
jgi:DNA-binding transcriptional MerR regulator